MAMVCKASGYARWWLGSLFIVSFSLICSAIDIPKWSVYEFALTTSTTYSNPYLNISVGVTFTGPGGVQKKVNGFWDGGNTFKVRFTPTVTGTWSYVTSSADAGMNGKRGSINCINAVSGNHGFLRRDANYKSSFVWDDGTRYFMMGQTYYEIVRLARAGTSWKTSIDNCKNYGFTKVRFLLYPWQVASDPGPISNPFISDNHDRIDVVHWQKMEEIIKYLDTKGMVADIIVYSDNGKYGTQTQEDRYVRYAIARFAPYHNVTWCVCNEWNYTLLPQSFFNNAGNIIRNEDRWLANGSYMRPLSVHQATRIDFQFFSYSWPTHAIIQYGTRNASYTLGDQWGNAGIVYNLGHNMPVVNDEYGYFGEPSFTKDQHRRALWGVCTAGGYGSTGDALADPPSWRTGTWVYRAEYDDIKRLVSFFTTKGFAYWKMKSQNALKTSGTRVYVLAETGKQYIIYAAIGGTFKINLASGTYTVKLYNPRTGAETTRSNVSGGVIRTFTMPDAYDWVMYMKSTTLSKEAADIAAHNSLTPMLDITQPLVDNCEIKIFTPSGRLLKTVHSFGVPSSSEIINNIQASAVARGKYFYVVKNSAGAYTKGSITINK